MHFSIAITGFVALYIFMLAAFGGWVIIGNVPRSSHAPDVGIQLCAWHCRIGAIYTLLNASTVPEQLIGCSAVLLGAGNVAGGTPSPTACSPCSRAVETSQASIRARFTRKS